MDVGGILLGSILVGGSIAVATGLIAVVGVLQVAGSAGLHEPPPMASGILARQRAVDARLRERYMQRQGWPDQWRATPEVPGPAAETVPGDVELPNSGTVVAPPGWHDHHLRRQGVVRPAHGQ
jgi:hypothetical protein